VEFFFNELSLHGQFHGVGDFVASIDAVMQIRTAIKRLGAEVYCRNDLTSARVTPTLNMPQVIHQIPQEKRRAWVSWITQQGPFWQEDRQHAADDWLEVDDGNLVTDSSVGEVAFRGLQGLSGDLVSLTPSTWLQSEIPVRYCRSDGSMRTICVGNHWMRETAVEKLANAGPRYSSWATLASFLIRKCERLRISNTAFVPLEGLPFHFGVAERFDVLITLLDALKGSFRADGTRSEEGERIYREHFNHSKAWFTDSSETEKNEFRESLTFAHPDRPGEFLFCPMHGKVKIPPQYRIHFSWPCLAKEPLYVVYVGPKITKR
jgi:hypothetical protein